MNHNKFLFAFTVVLSTMAYSYTFADTPAAPAIPQIDYAQKAIAERLTEEINRSLQLEAALLAANAQIEALKSAQAEKPATVPAQ